MMKEERLEKIAREIESCEECRRDSIGMAVPGEGSPHAQVMFIGEAPGKTEAATGRPFIGRSGKLLRLLIRESGLKEEEVYITSPVKYLPQRGTPTPAQIAHGRTHFLKQIEVINPKLLVLLGSVAVQGVLGKKIPVMQEHGKIIEDNQRRYFITLHPAAAIRFVKFKKIIEEDFKKVPALLKK